MDRILFFSHPRSFLVDYETSIYFSDISTNLGRDRSQTEKRNELRKFSARGSQV